MTREEEIITACKGFLAAYPNIDQAGLSIGFLDGAKWADITMIEKACKWLLKGGYFVNNTETINDFKQAMEK